jgi:serine/threonine protein kinase
MGRSSSGIGSVVVASKDPDAIKPWEQEGWQRLYVPDGDTLGEGGWGVVRPVLHIASGERRALKHPLHDDKEARARFKREIEVQSKIQHRHVMPVLDHDEEDFSWFTMPLAQRTLETGAPEMLNDELATVVIHAARGLKAAHDNGYVHRDVKPSNILEVGRGNDDSPIWVVGDFGVVRRPANEVTNLKTKHALGTAGFMAPEVVLGKHGNVSLLADVYSLGRTVAWATTGVRPEGLTPLEARWPWATLVAKMTAFAPDQRPNDMAEVIDAVADIVKILRSQRAKNWGKTSAPLALSASEESILAAVFDLAWEPEDGDEIVVAWNSLNSQFATTATLRIGLRRLVQLGFLKSGLRSSVEHDERVRSYSPTSLAWDWATKNESRISLILKPPSRPVPVGPDDDIPF